MSETLTKTERNQQYTHKDICLNCKQVCRANATGWCQSCRTVPCSVSECKDQIILMRLPDRRKPAFCKTHHGRKKPKPVVYF